jgi:hypothetical protein
MGAQLEFDAFAIEVRALLWVLEIEPAFQLAPQRARFMWAPYTAELQTIDDAHVRLGLIAHGELVRTIEYPMDDRSTRHVADGIIALFEPVPPEDHTG